jgi:LmbE family N-acetylglucosaminyl deacetylase
VNQFQPSGPVLVVSTHLDDAVLSCGHFLSGHPDAVVLTVLAGAPEKLREGYNANTTGELYAPDAVKKRREEDAAAMKYLAVKPPIWLGLYDNDFVHRFRRRRDHGDILREVGRAIQESEATSVVTPLGLVHSDHIAVADVCNSLAVTSELEWFLYMDMPYAQRRPKALEKRERDVRRTLDLEALEPLAVDANKKNEAFKHYKTQYLPIGRSEQEFSDEMKTPEQYWAVIR